jgi:hypothetical protein
MQSWEHTYRWHHRVHEQLGERLNYYLIRLARFDLERTKKEFDEFLDTMQLGSIRVFPVFGRYDLLVRAWLYPTIEATFRNWLRANLTGHGSSYSFSVTSLDRRWYWRSKPDQDCGIDRDLLESIHDQVIKNAQSGDEHLLRDLIEGGLVVELDQVDRQMVRFIVAVSLQENSDRIQETAVEDICGFLDRNREFGFTSVYRGSGFAQILIKGQLSNYFDLAGLPNWIGKHFQAVGATTETYLVHTPFHQSGNELIGDATFSQIHGKNLFAQSVVPELYNSRYSTRRKPVEQFLVTQVQHKRLSQRDRRLLRSYLVGYLDESAAEIAKVMSNFFIDVETYLRENHKEFGERVTGKRIGELYEELHIDKEKKALGAIFDVYSLAVKSTGRDPDDLGDLQKAAHLRNDVQHGNVNFLAKWDVLLQRLVDVLPRIRRLLSSVEAVTGEAYTGS